MGGDNMIEFEVIDLRTGKYPDLERIALREKWAKGLIYCDMEGFLLGEDGTLYLADECNNYVVCPHNRFSITMRINRRKHSFVY